MVESCARVRARVHIESRRQRSLDAGHLAVRVYTRIQGVPRRATAHRQRLISRAEIWNKIFPFKYRRKRKKFPFPFSIFIFLHREKDSSSPCTIRPETPCTRVHRAVHIEKRSRNHGVQVGGARCRASS